MKWNEWMRCAADALMPRSCAVCGNVLTYQERHLCVGCADSLPATHLHRHTDNEVEQRFAGRVPIERATSLLYYRKGGSVAQLLQDIKYRNLPTMARWLAARLCREPAADGFFAGIDLILPIPLHFEKRAKRGYNQSEYIARGVSDVSGIPVGDNLFAPMPHATQTAKDNTRRWENVQGVFAVRRPEELRDKHLLLIDDVLTTGATLVTAARELRKVEGVKVSILSLAVDKLD